MHHDLSSQQFGAPFQLLLTWCWVSATDQPSHIQAAPFDLLHSFSLSHTHCSSTIISLILIISYNVSNRELEWVVYPQLSYWVIIWSYYGHVVVRHNNTASTDTWVLANLDSTNSHRSVVDHVRRRQCHWHIVPNTKPWWHDSTRYPNYNASPTTIQQTNDENENGETPCSVGERGKWSNSFPLISSPNDLVWQYR